MRKTLVSCCSWKKAWGLYPIQSKQYTLKRCEWDEHKTNWKLQGIAFSYQYHQGLTTKSKNNNQTKTLWSSLSRMTRTSSPYVEKDKQVTKWINDVMKTLLLVIMMVMMMIWKSQRCWRWCGVCWMLWGIGSRCAIPPRHLVSARQLVLEWCIRQIIDKAKQGSSVNFTCLQVQQS